MNEDGSHVTRITDNALDDSQPAVSRDGQRITFVSPRAGNNEIFVIDAQGTRQLTHNAFDDKQPSFSPDGRKIVFLSTRNDSTNIFLLDINSKQETQLTSSGDYKDAPTFTSDGHILFASDSSSVFQIYEMDADGKNVAPVFESEGNQSQPTESPDGQRMAFVSDGEGKPNIYVLNRATHEVTQLTSQSQSNVDPSWSRDGKRILFSSDRTGDYDIYSMNADGSNVRDISNNPAADRVPVAQ